MTEEKATENNPKLPPNYPKNPPKIPQNYTLFTRQLHELPIYSFWCQWGRIKISGRICPVPGQYLQARFREMKWGSFRCLKGWGCPLRTPRPRENPNIRFSIQFWIPWKHPLETQVIFICGGYNLFADYPWGRWADSSHLPAQRDPLALNTQRSKIFAEGLSTSKKGRIHHPGFSVFGCWHSFPFCYHPLRNTLSNPLAWEEGYGKEILKPHFLKEMWGFLMTSSCN